MASQAEIAEHLGCHKQIIAKLQADGIFPKGCPLDEARYKACAYWRAVAAGRRGGTPPEEGGLDLTGERARLAHHQANKTAIEEQVLQRKLIPAEEVIEEWTRMATAMRAKMLALPTKLSSAAMSATTLQEVTDFAREEINTALKELVFELSEEPPDKRDKAAGSVEPEAPAEPERKRVGRPRKIPKPGVLRGTR